jgi:hypothetical protein
MRYLPQGNKKTRTDDSGGPQYPSRGNPCLTVLFQLRA